MSVNAVDAQSKAAANGCALRANRVVIDVLRAKTFTANVDDVGDVATDFRIARLIEVKDIMDGAGIPDDGRRFSVLPSNWFNIASVAEVFSNSQYTGPAMPLINPSSMRTWNGIHWMIMPNKLMPTDGTAIAGDPLGRGINGYGFAWHQDAVGSGTIDSGELRTEMQKISDEPAFSLVSEFDMASVILQSEGVIRIKAKTRSVMPATSGALI
jgi:hypothetical protein